MGMTQRMSALTLNYEYFIYTIALLRGLRYVAKHIFSTRARLPLPPGPPGHWLFGNQLPASGYVRSVPTNPSDQVLVTEHPSRLRR